MRILHITPHLGGGVGTVLLNYLAKVKDDHQVVCLDYANKKAIEVAKQIGLPLFDEMATKTEQIVDIIPDFDIVLIHWWNHPMLNEFLKNPLPPCRLIMWCHQSGLYPQNLFTEQVLTYPDMFVFCTSISYNSKVVQAFKDKEKLHVINPTGGVEHLKDVKPKPHKGFNIGYIGTVSYKKLHPRFLTICNQVNIPNVKFIVCGVPNGEQLKQEAKGLGIGHKFVFTGRVQDINPYLAIFDLFGYPLAPHHYGTCDQVLQEAMAAGVVPVVLANPMEQHMVTDGQTGIVATDTDAYIKALEMLYHNPLFRQALSMIARNDAIATFSLEKMINEWNEIFNKVVRKEVKHARKPIKEISA
jgi:glycosyltransferase involved in cell wall biosynthesis